MSPRATVTADTYYAEYSGLSRPSADYQHRGAIIVEGTPNASGVRDRVVIHFDEASEQKAVLHDAGGSAGVTYYLQANLDRYTDLRELLSSEDPLTFSLAHETPQRGSATITGWTLKTGMGEPVGDEEHGSMLGSLVNLRDLPDEIRAVLPDRDALSDAD